MTHCFSMGRIYHQKIDFENAEPEALLVLYYSEKEYSEKEGIQITSQHNFVSLRFLYLEF